VKGCGVKRKESQRGGCWRGQNLKQLEFFGIGRQRSLHRNQTRCKTVLAQKLWGTHGTMKSRSETMQPGFRKNEQQSGNRAEKKIVRTTAARLDPRARVSHTNYIRRNFAIPPHLPCPRPETQNTSHTRPDFTFYTPVTTYISRPGTPLSLPPRSMS